MRWAGRRSAMMRGGIAEPVLIALCMVGMGRMAAGMMVPVKAQVAQLLLEAAFDRSLAAHYPHKPWGWADMAPIARITVPRLGIERIVLSGGSGQAMAFGPTVLPGGAAPGAAGTIVIAAHRDTHFRFLQHVRMGDRITLQSVDARTRRYRVTGAEIVRWNRFAIAAGDRDDALDLSTCYPFGALGHGPLRYVVHATAIDRREP